VQVQVQVQSDLDFEVHKSNPKSDPALPGVIWDQGGGMEAILNLLYHCTYTWPQLRARCAVWRWKQQCRAHVSAALGRALAVGPDGPVPPCPSDHAKSKRATLQSDFKKARRPKPGGKPVGAPGELSSARRSEGQRPPVPPGARRRAPSPAPKSRRPPKKKRGGR
jgi:hypothetical protein